MTTKPAMPARPIDARLINWGLCQRGRGGGSMVTRETRSVSPYGGQGYKCMTDVICTMMREAAQGPKGGTTSQSRLDFDDAATIEAAVTKLATRHRLLLRDHYALDKGRAIICRQLDIKHWPTSHFDRELRAAQDAVEVINRRMAA